MNNLFYTKFTNGTIQTLVIWGFLRHENIITPFSWLSQGYVYMSHAVYLHPESVKVNLWVENSKLSFELSLKNK